MRHVLPNVSEGLLETVRGKLNSSGSSSVKSQSPNLPAIINANWRVVFDPLQWVLQHREGRKWNPRFYCVSKTGLLRCIREYCGQADIRKIVQLPQWHPDRNCTAPKAATLRKLVHGLSPSLRGLVPRGPRCRKKKPRPKGGSWPELRSKGVIAG